MVTRKFYERSLKPIFDRIFAAILLFVLSPLLAFLLLVLFIHFSGRPFFVQQRVGKNNRIFLMLKFRSMVDETGGEKTDELNRTTVLGSFIRKTSLDELPQLINVLKGEMSIVGPRPLLVDYLPFYNREELKRHLVRPGITGLAQVMGRNHLDWGNRMKLDVKYAKEISFILDIKIMAKTILEIFKPKKASFKNEEVITFIEYASNR